MAAKRYIILITCLLCFFVAEAQTSAGPALSLHREGDSLLRLSFVMPRQSNYIDEGFLHYAPMTGMNLSNGIPGQPALPTASTLVCLPKGSTLSVTKVEGEETVGEISGDPVLPLAPILRAWAKDSERPPYEPDPKTYGTDAFVRSGDLLEVESLGIMGQWQMFRLTVRPTAYNPVRGLTHEYITLNASINIHMGATLGTSEGNNLLVVSRPEFREGLQPFVQWKRQEGYNVEELYVNTHKRDSIKAQIQPWFEEASALSPAPDYVLLVGDAAQIQSFIGETSLDDEGHTTDLYYVEFTGDYLPEAMVARWPVNDTAELRTVVEKTLRYEQFIDMDTSQLKRMLLVAGNETFTPAPTTTNGQVNYVSREVKLAHPEIDTLCYHNPQSGTQLDSIVADIGRGAGLLNYTAHCTAGGWTSPALSIGGVEEAHGTQPMVYVNNCCKSNTFGGTGFGEQLLRLPVGGGVGVIGATNSTLWNEDYYWAVGPKWPVALTVAYDSSARGAFDALVGSQPSITTMGELLTAGNLAVTAFGTNYSKFYWEIYCLFGDPTLKPWIGVPQHITLQLSDSLYHGASEVSVSGTAGATVTVMQGGEVIGRTVLDATGMATVRLCRTLDTLPVVLTATGAGLRPRMDTVAVGQPTSRMATLRDVEVEVSKVRFTVENTGIGTIDSLDVLLVQTGEDSLAGAWIAAPGLRLYNLQAGERRDDSLTMTVSENGILPLWQGHLQTANIEVGVMCDLMVRHALPTVYPTLRLKLLEANGEEARRVRAGHAYRLEATVEGSYDTMWIEAEDTPFGNRQTSNIPTLDFVTSDSLCALAIGGTLKLGHWTDYRHYWLEPGNRIESFEHGFDSHPWRNSGRVPWVIDSAESHSGHFSARSGAIDHGQLTQICLEVEMPLRDTISYWVKSSTEEQYDKMVFSVDGRDFTPEAWGFMDWRQRIHVLNAGHHTLCWRYVKDAADSRGSDCVWIDDLQIPLSLWDTSYVWDCLSPMVGIEPSQEATPLMTLYPNPTTGHAWLSGPQGTEVSISDALGRTIETFTLNGNEAHHWDATALPAGIYFATGTHNGRRHTQKLILIKH